MAELLFIATTIFVAYVMFVVVGGKKDKPESTQAAAKPVITPEAAAPVEKEAAPVEPAKPVAKPTPAKAKTAPAAKKTAPTPKPAPAKPSAGATPSDSLKNPKTGEVAKLPNNYAFAKRWIKEALVEEGLLEKIYKNNELDSATTAKIQDALAQLKAMEKYQ